MNGRVGETELRTLATEMSQRDASALELDTDLREALNLDSLAALRLLAAVEKRFGVRFPDDQLSELRTFRRLLAALEDAAKNEGES